MYRPSRTAAPSETPVSLTEAKAHLRVDSDDENTLISALVQAATDHVDGYGGILGRCLVTQTWRQDFDQFSQKLYLPMLAASVTSVVYVDDYGGSTTVGAANYELLNWHGGSYVRFIDDYPFPSGLAEAAAVRVTFTSGFGAAADVPAAIKAAMLLMIGHWYANREAINVGNIVSELPLGAMSLLEPYRHVGV